MISREFVKVPKERIAVVIGKHGEIKRYLEKETKTKITVDSKTGEIVIESTPKTDDPLAVWKARDVILAIGRGFSPERAKRLLKDGQLIEIIDISQFTGRSKNSLRRVKGRIIGENGKTRKIIEETTGVSLSIYGRTVTLIGDYEWIRVAKKAIMMLIEGAPHGTVYKFLSKMRREYKRQKFSILKPVESSQ
ncbi:MAG: KH domain-containing protein [Candidatus Baldrarchaeia archaeon]